MWGPYRLSIEQHAPNCRIVYDKFHVMQHGNQAATPVKGMLNTSETLRAVIPDFIARREWFCRFPEMLNCFRSILIECARRS